MEPDLASLQAFLNQASTAANPDPLVVEADDQTAYSDLFSRYLAPEMEKYPPMSTAMGDPAFSLAPFASTSAPNTSAAGSGDLSPATPSTFDPSTFMPTTLPGSPFSPESDDHSTTNGRSPVSLAELDFSTAPVLSGSADDFAIDPSVFDAPTSTIGFDTESLFATLDSGSSAAAPATSVEAAAPTSLAVSPAVLPPLPSLPVAPPAQSRHSTPSTSSSVSASGRPKRGIAHSVIREVPEEEEERQLGNGDADMDLYSSDASSALGASATKRSTRSRRVSKKARSKSPSITPTGDEEARARKLARTSVVPLQSATLHRTAQNDHLPPVPLWADKPDAKEYAKLSSKEKRQLRNKISARNFRHRRKEYITTLEEEISTRDNLITELQDEVGTIRAENTGLRTEVATLREQWQNLLDKLSNMTTPQAAAAGSTAVAGLGTNPSRAVASAGASAVAAEAAAVKQEEDAIMPEAAPTRRIGTRSTSGVQRPNLSKDVAPLSRRATGNNWGAFGAGASNSFMSVHTTLVPDVDFTNLADGLHNKPAVAARSPFSGQSFNPALNSLSEHQLAQLPAATSHLRSAANGTAPRANAHQPTGTGSFEDFFASNPYWLRPDALDQNRAALYGRLAHNAAGLLAAQKQAGEAADAGASQQQQPAGSADKTYLPLPNGFRPAFFRSPKADSTSSSSTTNELLAYQSPSATAAAATAAAFSPPWPMPIAPHQDALEQREQATMARVAQLANQTLLQRLTASFWDAFVGSAPEQKVAGSPPPALDAEKVKAVLLGKARVQVVPHAAPESESATAPLTTAAATGTGLGALERQMSALSVGGADPAGERCSFPQVGRRWLGGEKRA